MSTISSNLPTVWTPTPVSLPCSLVAGLRGLSQIIFPTVSVIMTLRGGGGGWESEGVTLTNQACFFSQDAPF